VVDAELMSDKEIGDKDLVLRSSRATKWYVNEFGTGWSQCVERLLPSTSGSEEKPTEQSGSRKNEESAVYSPCRCEPGNTLGLFRSRTRIMPSSRKSCLSRS
jgi:hypothetical protein